MMVKIIGGHGGVAPGARATSYLIDGKLLIDAGSVGEGIPIEEQVQIENILISHPHMDHIKDLAFLSDNCFGLKRVPFEIYAGEKVRRAIKRHVFNNCIWPDFSKLPSSKNPTLRFHTIFPEKALILGEYKILPVLVNHPGPGLGFIIESKGQSLVFTQDTGPTDRIWELARKFRNLKAIFTEVSFPNAMQEVATASQHHTPKTIKQEIRKMPKKVPILLGHLKPNFQTLLYEEIESLKNSRIVLMGLDDQSYHF